VPHQCVRRDLLGELEARNVNFLTQSRPYADSVSNRMSLLRAAIPCLLTPQPKNHCQQQLRVLAIELGRPVTRTHPTIVTLWFVGACGDAAILPSLQPSVSASRSSSCERAPVWVRRCEPATRPLSALLAARWTTRRWL